MLNVVEQRQIKIELVEPMQEDDVKTELDYDEENKQDLAAVSDYAQDIFAYYKDREVLFVI